jgi:hypothetical protein
MATKFDPPLGVNGPCFSYLQQTVRSLGHFAAIYLRATAPAKSLDYEGKLAAGKALSESFREGIIAGMNDTMTPERLRR